MYKVGFSLFNWTQNWLKFYIFERGLDVFDTEYAECELPLSFLDFFVMNMNKMSVIQW